MATTNIELDIENITGVADANAQFLISAQKFVVASIPKNLLKWSTTFTVPSNHGGNTSDGVKITMPIGTDSILDVSRNGFSGTEVPYSMKGFIANTASLHLATETYPKYYFDNHSRFILTNNLRLAIDRFEKGSKRRCECSSNKGITDVEFNCFDNNLHMNLLFKWSFRFKKDSH